MKGLTIAMVYSYEPVSQLRRCVHSLQYEVTSIQNTVGWVEWVLIQTPKARGKDVSFFPGKVIASQSENLGFNRGLALNESRTEGFYFMDPDCWIPENSLKALCEAFESHREDPSIIAWAGPNILKSNHLRLNRFLDWLGSTRFLHGGSAQIERGKADRWDWHSPTCHILYRRHLLKDSFDSSQFPIVGEDLEFHFRLHQKGFRIWICSRAPVWHEQASDLATYFKKIFRYGTAQTRLLKVQPQSFRNKRLLLIFGFLLWMSCFFVLPANFQLVWLGATVFGAGLLVLLEIFFFHGEKEFASFVALYFMTMLVYLGGQIAGLLLPLSKLQNEEAKTASKQSSGEPTQNP